MHRILPDPALDEPHDIDRMIGLLRAEGFLDGDCDHARFEALRAAVRAHFTVTWTSITPPMERLLYAIAAARRPKNVACIGVFCGNTLIWNVGAACGPGACYEAERLVGVEIDPEAVKTADGNLRRIGVRDRVDLRTEDGHLTLERADYPIDLLYLDANGPLPGTTGPSTKLIYLSLLQRIYDRLPQGALVVAHDTVPAWFVKSAGAYLDFVRDKAHFRYSVSLEPDDQGIEVSVK